MDLQTIDVDKNVARREFLKYKHAIQERHEEEKDKVTAKHRDELHDLERRHRAQDEAVLKGYRALSRGKQLLNLPETIRAGGYDDEFRPRLAVVRSDERVASVRVHATGAVAFSGQAHRRRRALTVRNVIPEDLARANIRWSNTWTAKVPSIPPHLRPPVKSLQRYHILWEAEYNEEAPVDPALLKHLEGDLYVVVAVWDLTPLEQAVLGGRN